MEKQKITYSEYEFLIDDLTDHLLNLDKKFDGVFAPPRGGLPIAVHLSHHLNIERIITTKKDIFNYENGNLLFVDDIIDTGDTISSIISIINQVDQITNTVYTCSLFFKPHSKFKPNYFVDKTNNWIVFPWEKLDETPNREMYKDLT